jgi:predicted Zn-dependent protease
MRSATALTDQAEFRRLAEVAFAAAACEHKFLALSDQASGTTRFAVNRITQNVHSRERSLTFTATFGQQSGSGATTDFTDDGLRECVRQAEALARAAPPDPEFLPPLPPQMYPVLPTLRPETAAATPARMAGIAGAAINACDAAGMQAAGIISTSVRAAGVAASSGLFGYEQRSEAQFSLTATAPDSTGWVSNANRSLDDLDVAGLTRVAIEKARSSAGPRELPAGRYHAILEPAAVAGLVGPLIGATRAKAYYRGTSAVRDRLGQQIVDPRLSLRNRPDHPSLMGAGFDEQGLPANYKTWIERGVLRELDYDRFTAQEHGVPPSFGLDAPYLSGESPAAETVEDLVRTTARGVLVTNFWYIRSVNPTDLTLTGMTRDGVFLVEDGRIVGGLLNFRWHDSPLRALSAVDAFTPPMDALTWERGKMLLPAVRVRDFNFSSVTRF